jgi:hypothetical protein
MMAGLLESLLGDLPPLGATAPRLIRRDPFQAEIERGGAIIATVTARLAPLGFQAGRPMSSTASAASTNLVILFPPGTDVRREDRIRDVSPPARAGLALPKGGLYGTGFRVHHVEPWDGCTLADCTAEE